MRAKRTLLLNLLQLLVALTLVVGVMVAAPNRSLADATVVTRAMKASTIAEVFVEEDLIRVELEIGSQDIESFRNLLPDELFEKLSGEVIPFEERLQTFLAQDWRMLAGELPLAGQLNRIVPATRVIRDEITGLPLPVQPEDAEKVIRVELHYPLQEQPQTLALRPPLAQGHGRPIANIGFVVYHQGVAVNDFRYLSQQETMDLDWEDPWHSRFRNKNLRRQFDSPMSAFLYVEHFEVRKEIIVRPKDLQSWVDLGLAGRTTIPIALQADIKKRAVEFLAAKNPLTIDGREVNGRIDRIHFIRRTLRKTGVIDPPEELNVHSATLGVIFVYEVPKLPQEVAMHWQLFAPKLQSIPAATTDEAGGLPATISQEDPVLRWRNYLTHPKVPAMLSISPPPTAPRITIPVVSLVLAVTMLGLTVAGLRSDVASPNRGRILVAGIACLVGGVVTVPLAHTSVVNPFAPEIVPAIEQKDEILASLLHNTYRAFDRREENLVYDRLARSISGDLLTEVYLQTRRSMELEGQGGARVKVDDVELVESEPIGESKSNSFVQRARWNVSGSVGHWGHTHQRTTQYQAEFKIEPIENQWKITQMDLLEQERLEAIPGSAAP